MAVYEYICPKCEKRFEVRRPISRADEATMCPNCGTKSEKAVCNFAAKVPMVVDIQGKKISMSSKIYSD
ncbi:MAG: zinc ribbon domain-containing protein [Dehalococcoidia bacterium]|nr:zinc ribbon domain-containing protein [Dehalococcoidia bacterium]